MEAIECRIHVAHMLLDDGPKEYFARIQKLLEEAGIKFEGDRVQGGTLHSMIDPNDFGVTIWKFYPFKE